MCAAATLYHLLTVPSPYRALFIGQLSSCVPSFRPRSSASSASKQHSFHRSSLRFPTRTSRSHQTEQTHLMLILTLYLIGSQMEILVRYLRMDRIRPRTILSLLVRMKGFTQNFGQMHNTPHPLRHTIKYLNPRHIITARISMLLLPLQPQVQLHKRLPMCFNALNALKDSRAAATSSMFL